ncbi:MAG: hypothetical protein OXF02_04255 [Simkaniaceae bacterium]|nr:hypothetical protein [Simkaniaceae bacterium]
MSYGYLRKNLPKGTGREFSSQKFVPFRYLLEKLLCVSYKERNLFQGGVLLRELRG